MKVTEKIYIHAEWNTYENKFDYFFCTCEADWDNHKKLIAVQEIEFELPPDEEMRLAAYKGLMKDKTELLANAQVRANQIDEKASRLLALEDRSNECI